MTTRARTPNVDAFDHVNNGTPTAGKAADPSPLANATGAVRPTSAAFSYMPGDDLDDGDVGPSVQQLEGAGLHRTASSSSRTGGVSRSNTLQKKGTLNKRSSLKRTNSRKSLAAGSIKGVHIDDKKHAPGDEYNSAFYCPVPTTGAPTEILANRFQTWRKFLKDLIAYFKEVQNSYEQRSKALLKVANVINNTQAPTIFMSEGGLSEATKMLRDYHRQANTEANKARNIEEDVITQLAGLRADLGQKIKEIKSLSGDFKNSVDKEKDHTRKAVNGLQEALAVVDRDSSALVGKEDPYIIKMNVDRQIERQLDEENYLHRAYLNLEGSGRELESIVVGEVQKAYNALAGILKREADEAYNTVDALRNGPVTVPKDMEWNHFIDTDSHFISADTPLRKVENIEYPGKNHPAAAEVRAGMLERKSKYLKSYTPGWYVLSPTHLHEFKSADRIYSQPPVMSLLLSDQKLGSHSQPGASSHKFMLKGRQTGSMHRGHSWVFRAETYDTMLAWYDDIQALTEKSGEERNDFVRKHARSFSAGSHRASSISGDSAMDEDEADDVPFSASQSLSKGIDGSSSEKPTAPTRPEPGGRFPSDLNTNRHLSKSFSHSSGGSSLPERQDLSTMAGGLHQPSSSAYEPATLERSSPEFPLVGAAVIHQAPATHESAAAYQQHAPAGTARDATYTPAHDPQTGLPVPPPELTSPQPPADAALGSAEPSHLARNNTDYGSWMAPAAGGAAVGLAAGLGPEAYWRSKREQAEANASTTAEASDTGKVPLVTTAVQSPVPHDHGAPTTITTVAATDHAAGPIAPQTPLTSRSEGLSVLSESTAPTELSMSPGVEEKHTKYDTDKEGQVNAQPTGSFFPKILRHNTDVSVRDLYVPGGFP